MTFWIMSVQEVIRAMSVGVGEGGILLRITIEADLIIQCFSWKVTDKEGFKVTEHWRLGN